MRFVTKLFLAGIGTSIITLVVSLWTFISNWHDIKGSYFSDAASFSLAEGRIVSSSTQASRSKRRIYYNYSIEYAFTADGKNYRSNEITFASNHSLDRTFAQIYVDKYPIGKQVTVYYDPHDPSFSVLEPEKKSSAAVGLFFMTISALVLVLSGGYFFIRKKMFSSTNQSVFNM